MITTKKNDKKHWDSENAWDSEEDEDSDETSVTEPEKKAKSKRNTQAKCKYSVTSRLSFLVWYFCYSIFSDVLFPFYDFHFSVP